MPPSVLARSARGASFLILLQIGSRALTFIVNQVLLRYLSPDFLGAATQLELFSVSTLYFSRESIRVALQRQRHDAPQPPSQNADSKKGDEIAEAGNVDRVQEAINLSYLAIGLGSVLTFVFQWLYKRNADPAVLSIPYIQGSLQLYALATIIELFHEPLFALAQQQMLYGTRASAEMQATFLRCIVTCSTAIYASHSDLNVGVLPFAIGQLSYAILLILAYLYGLLPALNSAALSIFPRRPRSKDSQVFPPDLLRLSFTLYTQSIFKQLLTSGDAYLIALLTTLPSQGAYALASNYGGLLARILFQPIEEFSRSLLARLLPPKLPPREASLQASQAATNKARLEQAVAYLTTILHLYFLLSILLICWAGPLTPLLLHTIAGARWSDTEAPSVLNVYCVYLPFLACNGLLEAYVSAVATPAQLRQQSIWMVGSSALFGVTGWLVLGVWGMGAKGLVIVNAVVMLGRIWWSGSFMKRDLAERGGGMIFAVSKGEADKAEVLDVSRVLPHSVAFMMATTGQLVLMYGGVGMGMRDLAKVGALLGVLGSVFLYSERHFLLQAWRLFNPPQEEEEKNKPQSQTAHDEEAKKTK
ncbi:MAG: Oligosaccharide translocation protein rft1 [Ramalina farinacea]|uniref:Man(5)GlcNAc(2)-PP-dolichol translocation protein RFT1 n=1 Tax=Ramalina farinacea TaxID=258253 RepID=A0AA43TXF2_9LECA|nr:Oligosaccharide translocation protein rft1 [Ramalina farinacea]